MAVANELKQGELAPTNSVHKEIVVELGNTTNTNDIHVLTLSDFGCTKLVAVSGFVHNTEDSVIVPEAPTTVVSSGVVTITVGGSAVTNKKRVYRVVMR